MRFSAPKHRLFFFLFFTYSVILALSDPRTYEAGLYCGTARSPAGTNFVPIFVKEMENILQLVNAHHWGTYRVNTTYALAQCHQDLSPMDCQLCYAASRTRLPRCLPAADAHIYLDGCFLRYDNYSFYAEAVDSARDSVNCTASGGASVVAEAKRAGFVRSVGTVIENVTKTAVAAGGFAVGEAGGVYALAQCWKTVSSDGCRVCLEKASREVRGCVPSTEGRGMNAGCYLRYSPYKFYNDGQDSNQRSGSLGTGAIVAIVLSGTAFLMLSLFAAYTAYARLLKKKAEQKNLGRISSLFNKSNLSFKYDTLEKATDYFNPSRKIGQGGAGSVYMGTLPDGKVVAVKRLVFNTRQWVDEFFNEVNLISGIKHKNLVKLLGCSIEGPESLLVYEYVLNKSLDQFIFDEQKHKILKWKHRFNIVLGTAEGLAYLHGGSAIRIIHRDIKSSNVLIDENLNPKIADFGLVRCFAADQSHLSTGIAGTLGYMAPEYLVKGQLTEKADVYSFGVLVMEIVTGRKNNVFIQDSGSLLQTVWRHYTSNTLIEAIDPTLRVDFPAKESSDMLQIGLLCTQASAALRPSMEEVVRMLTSKHCEIPNPNQPPFMKTGMLEMDSSLRSYTINSSYEDARIETSYSSTESFGIINSSDRPSRS